jgi:hypothetical protein
MFQYISKRDFTRLDKIGFTKLATSSCVVGCQAGPSARITESEQQPDDLSGFSPQDSFFQMAK